MIKFTIHDEKKFLPMSLFIRVKYWKWNWLPGTLKKLNLQNS